MSQIEAAENAAIYARRIMALEKGYDALRTVNNRLQAENAALREQLAKAGKRQHMSDLNYDALEKQLERAQGAEAEVAAMLRRAEKAEGALAQARNECASVAEAQRDAMSDTPAKKRPGLAGAKKEESDNNEETPKG